MHQFRKMQFWPKLETKIRPEPEFLELGIFHQSQTMDREREQLAAVFVAPLPGNFSADTLVDYHTQTQGLTFDACLGILILLLFLVVKVLLNTRLNGIKTEEMVQLELSFSLSITQLVQYLQVRIELYPYCLMDYFL